MAKETYPTHMAKEACVWGKEAYVYGKRGLRIWQERPTCMAKEAYVYGKRGLITRTGMAYLKAPGVGIGGKKKKRGQKRKKEKILAYLKAPGVGIGGYVWPL